MNDAFAHDTSTTQYLPQWQYSKYYAWKMWINNLKVGKLKTKRLGAVWNLPAK